MAGVAVAHRASPLLGQSISLTSSPMDSKKGGLKSEGAWACCRRAVPRQPTTTAPMSRASIVLSIELTVLVGEQIHHEPTHPYRPSHRSLYHNWLLQAISTTRRLRFQRPNLSLLHLDLHKPIRQSRKTTSPVCTTEALISPRSLIPSNNPLACPRPRHRARACSPPSRP